MITSLQALREMLQELFGQPVGAVSHAFGVEITKEVEGVTLRAAILTGDSKSPTTVVIERKLVDATVESLVETIQKILSEALFGPYLRLLRPDPLPQKTMPLPTPPWTHPIVPGMPGEFPQWPGSPTYPHNPMYPGSPSPPFAPWVQPLSPGPTYIGDLPFPPNQIICGDIQGIAKFDGTATGLTQMNDPNGDPT